MHPSLSPSARVCASWREISISCVSSTERVRPLQLSSYVPACNISQARTHAQLDIHVQITLLGTNANLASEHGLDPRETPEVILGKEGLRFGAGVLGVMGTLIAKVCSLKCARIALHCACRISFVVCMYFLLCQQLLCAHRFCLFFFWQGKPVGQTHRVLSESAALGSTWIKVDGTAFWVPGDEIVITPTDYGI